MLFPDVPFTEGDIFTPELAYESFKAPYFDDQPQYLGHRAKLADSELSDNPGAVKAKVVQLYDSLLVTVESGRTLRYASGAFQSPSGAVTTVASGLVVAPDNATSYVYLDQTGAILCTVDVPVIRYLLAKVITVGGAVSSLEDSRMTYIKHIAPIAAAIKIFGGSNSTDKVCTASEVFDRGYYYFRDFTVPGGVGIIVDKFTRIFCSGNVNIGGTITVGQAASGASGYSSGCVSGVNLGGLSGSGAGAGSGSSSSGNSAGSSYPYAAQPFGSGGGLGFMSGAGATNEGGLGDGGKGGGGLWIEAAGTVTVTGTITANGTNGSIGSVVVGSPTISGAGGGSGGLILLSSLKSVTLTASSTLSVTGGSGANGVGQGKGGSGGGGGYIVLQSPNINTTGATLLLAGGGLGATAGAGFVGGGGGAGFGGAGGNQTAGSIGKVITLNAVPLGG